MSVYDQIAVQVHALRERDLEPWYVVVGTAEWDEARREAVEPLVGHEIAQQTIFGLPVVVYHQDSPGVRLYGSPFVHARPRSQ